ncbi:MAG: lactate utilization protein B [Corynebacterium sp.]|nr:lactate utilization protein B [Corynebacterium sp.]
MTATTAPNDTTVPPFPHAAPGALRGKRPFPQQARLELTNETQRRNLHKATTTIRSKREQRMSETPDWEDLRNAASAIKLDVGQRLADLLVEFTDQVEAHGGHVHWARDGEEANAIIVDLVNQSGATHVTKVKSMLTQEIGMNEALEEAGISAQETDLAELIVQLGHDTPSHIVVPAIHRGRAEVRDIFIDNMPGADPTLSDNPADLAEAARRFLRNQFMESTCAISGANFGVAETGTVCIVESEGNGRMNLTLPDTLITVMGIEKLVPTFRDLEVFLQLLPRSATGERMNPYTSLFTGVSADDGPGSFHIVLVDNGRTATLSNPIGREALKCIRCASCLNVCPVYERVGGHAYGSTYPGPIGSVLSPQLTGIDSASDPNGYLPFASTLCGRCNTVCPVMIPLTDLLVEMRYQKVRSHPALGEKTLMRLAELMWGKPALWKQVTRLVFLGRVLGKVPVSGNGTAITRLPGPLGAWTTTRDVPLPPTQSFRQWWASEEAKQVIAANRPPASASEEEK